MPTLSLRVDLDDHGRVGPGKITLLESVAESGSISAGARRMSMSYKHAWDLIEEMNVIFGQPLVATSSGGRHGGGARLTKTGRSVVSHYRAIEQAAAAAALKHLQALQAEIRRA